MNDKNIVNNNAKILSDMADINIEDATNMLIEAMKKYDNYRLSESELNTIADKLNNVELS